MYMGEYIREKEVCDQIHLHHRRNKSMYWHTSVAVGENSVRTGTLVLLWETAVYIWYTCVAIGDRSVRTGTVVLL